MNLDKEVFELSMEDILPNRFQPREVFDQQALNELALSIREHGVIQPIIVRKIGDKYEIVAGERRFRASQIAGKKTIPALVRNIDDRESAKVALLENLQRKNLTSIEEARTYNTILKLDNLTQEELANNLGKSQSAVANKLRLLNLDVEVQDALLNEKISERHARSLLNLSDHDKQKELLNKVIMNRMTVKQLDDEIAILTGKKLVSSEEIESLDTLPITGESINNFVKQPEIASAIVADSPIPISNQTISESQSTNQEIPEISNNVPEQSKINEQIFFQNPTPTNNNISIDDILKKYNMPNQTQSAVDNQNVSSNNNIEKPVFTSPVLTEEKVEDIIKNPIPENSVISDPIFDTVDISQLKYEPVPKENNINSLNQPFQINQNEMYDLRFAINNFRQAVQNTEKFGFKIDVEEFDFDNVYQLVIKINKNK